MFNEGCVFGLYPSPQLNCGEIYIEARGHDASVVIGNRVIINNNAVIIADKSKIIIGDDTLIGPNFTCFDGNFHPLSLDNRLTQDYKCNPVTIGKNVFIGANVIILQGVSVGDNSVIGAGSVITKDIPNNVIATTRENLKFYSIR
ncbi:DapH/DapD/GlmU-related protein [Edwardsiella tarda]|uniref:DapH/DapD/GlmU-related protein n=1 Tax=Edwardsiella tarda TaxID=636 RepID=UPI003F6600EF